MEKYYDMRIPDTGPEFEKLAKLVCERRFGVRFELYGRSGQKQSGIDLFSSGFRICVQCKNYQGNDGVGRLLAGMRKDLHSACEKFGQSMTTYVWATTVQRDVRVQDLVSQLSAECSADLQILFWEDFQEMFKTCPEIRGERHPGNAPAAAPEVRMIGGECYIFRASKTELVGTAHETRVLLTGAEYRILSCLVDRRDTPVSFAGIARDTGGKGSRVKDQLLRIRKKLDQIENGLGQKRLDIDERMQTCTLNIREASGPSLSCVFRRGKDDPKDAFVYPDHFILPQRSLQQLTDSAFSDSRVHVISGQRGMGKSELARCFARTCAADTGCRDVLQYNTVIWTTYSEKGLRDTIARLAYSGDAEDRQVYSEKLRLLGEIPKPCLLVIDNFDNETNFAEELSRSNEAYTDLLRCGCHILFTSKVNLRDCYAVRQTEISPLPEEELKELFWSLCEEEKTDSNRKKASELIETYLDRNTYLVILAAKLTETTSLDEILEAFRSLSVAKMPGKVSGEKDGEKQPAASLLDQYQMMFDLSSVQHDERKRRLLYNLALLPIDGTSYRDFFSMAFLPEEQEQMQLAFSQLRDSFWVFLRNRQVSIHPMVRELVLNRVKGFRESHIQQYIRSLNRRMYVENFTEYTGSDLQIAVSAFEVCKTYAVDNPDITMLVSNIASTYDLFRNDKATYKYCKEALPRLQASAATKVFQEDLALAGCYNMVGYAVLHSYDEPDSDELSEQWLLTAKELTDALALSHQDQELTYLRAKIRGNQAALCIAREDYGAALQMHTSARDHRLELVQDSPSPRTKLFLAAAYKGIATDYFYLSRQSASQEKLDLLRASLENHAHSVALYEEIFSVNSPEACIANIRLVGTGITWITAAESMGIPVDAQAELEIYIGKTLSTARYLCTVAPVAAEIKNCLSNAERLAQYLDRVSCGHGAHYRRLEETARLIGSVSSDQSKEWNASVALIRQITQAHIQEENAYV